MLILSLAQIWLRNFAEWHHTLLSFIETIGIHYIRIGGGHFNLYLALAYFTTTFLMWAVGGLRPSWLAVCKPDQSFTPGYPYRYFTDSICTADSYVFIAYQSMLIRFNVKYRDDVRTGQQTFPSGHAATIFASYGWLVLYLNAKWKVGNLGLIHVVACYWVINHFPDF